jgi:two-component system chemotaxis sensor kinase CheA
MLPTELDLEGKEILAGFVQESREMLDNAEPLLIELEKLSRQSGEVDLEMVNTIFRLFHSLKGGAGFLGLTTVGMVTHDAETLLDMFRRGKATIHSDHINVMNRTCDFIRRLLDHIETTQGDKGFEDQAAVLVQDLKHSIARITDQPNPQQPKKKPSKERKRTYLPVARETDSEELASGKDLQPSITPELIQQFVTESQELLASAEESLRGLEKDPSSLELVSQAFRALHSLKGNAGFFGFADLEEISHQAEILLDKVGVGCCSNDNSVFSLLLEILDFLRIAITQISRGGSPAIPAKPGLINLLKDAASKLTKPEPCSGEERRGETRKADSPASQHQSVRVDVEKLDSLLDLVSELVISEAMVAKNPDLKAVSAPLDRFEKSVLQLDKTTRELQDVVTSIRMIPLSGTFRRMIRLVRDLSQKAGKVVELEIIGEETEMDKTVIELINDPLIHIIRNCIDHGLETPEERQSCDKPESGRLTLEAKYVGSEVWISISDDGKGLNREKILHKAREKGIISDDGSGLRDDEVWQIVFQPGFSTADKITDVSGRGVGMDVVRRNIEKIRGKVDIQNEKGNGATVILKIPLTLAIIDGMLIRIGNSRYIIPIMDIRESWRPVAGSITKLPDGQEIINYRGKLFPLVRLPELLQVESNCPELTDGIAIMAESEGTPICLFADEILGQQQIVIKGLPSYIGNLKFVSGCAILGDGDISLIIDVAGIINLTENETVEMANQSTENNIT